MDSISERYRALFEISEAIAAHRQFADFFQGLKNSLGRIIPFDGIGVSLFDPEQQITRLYLHESGMRSEVPVGQTFRAEESPTASVLEAQQPFYAPDLDQEDRFPAICSILRRNDIRSYCVLPLCTAQRRLGALHIGSSIKNAYTAADIEFMQQVARQVAVALENVVNYEAAASLQKELAGERDHLRLLLNVSDAVAAELGIRELFSAISACLRKVLDVDFASLTLIDEESGLLRRQSLDFPAGPGIFQENALLPREGTPAGEALSKKAPVLWHRADLERVQQPWARNLLQEGLIVFCAVPLISRRRELGTINLCSRCEDAYDESHFKQLMEVAAHFAIALDNALAYRQIEELNQKLAKENLYLADEIRSNYFFEEIIGDSKPLRSVLQQVDLVAPSDSTVLICGETGTGKEQIARAIHDLSPRRQSTFVKLNCAAIPTGLIESEMFGHEKGAFTGAVGQRIGRFELAHRGTLFLDEIGDIPIELQPKLLRVLQEQEFERLGSAHTIRVDVRLIAATNRNLPEMVERGAFRTDLFYRLNVFPITVPPLRQRTEDIPLLIRYFVQQVARRMGKKIRAIPTEAMEKLIRYPWPGNIRELQNLVERAVILSPGDTLQIPFGELKFPSAPAGLPAQTLAQAERRHILDALRETNWVVGGPSGAAARLGMKRSTLQSRMQKLGIHKE
jgi:formate hydrogenlyase transcriptional activator